MFSNLQHFLQSKKYNKYFRLLLIAFIKKMNSSLFLNLLNKANHFLNYLKYKIFLIRVLIWFENNNQWACKSYLLKNMNNE